MVAEETSLMLQLNKHLRINYFFERYTFRQRVPQELVPVLGKKEICKGMHDKVTNGHSS